jgi:HEAT repeat protein
MSVHEASLKSLVACALQDDGERAWSAVNALRCRGTPELLEVLERLARARNPRKRELALRVAGQLMTVGTPSPGQGPRYRDWGQAASQQLLSRALGDGDARVRAAAISGLGTRPLPSALPRLLESLHAPQATLRLALATALGSYDEEASARALTTLMRDEDRHVRNWATFSLGSLLRFDDEAVREALLRQCAQADPEIRGEALVGLARRGDARVDPLIEQELAGPFTGSWVAEAAERRAGARWVPALARRLSDTELTPYHLATFQDALAACEAAP